MISRKKNYWSESIKRIHQLIKIISDPNTGKEREIFFGEEQYEMFNWWVNTGCKKHSLYHPYLLLNRDKKVVVTRVFMSWCLQAGIKSHSLRRSFATHFFEKTKDISLIQILLGHESPTTTAKSLCLNEAHFKQKSRSIYLMASHQLQFKKGSFSLPQASNRRITVLIEALLYKIPKYFVWYILY